MASGDENNVLWRPDQQAKAGTVIARYIEWLSSNGYETLGAENYHALHQWSVSNIETFWQSVWDFCQLKSQTPAERVLSSPEMPGTKWFPGMQLNFAENLLRFANTDDGEKEAVVSICETRKPLRRTFNELFMDVGAVEQYLRSKGVTTGDRVAGIITNGYEALVGMLAATSMGAIWSSASPDFGESAILDRFGQIEPTALLVVNGYGYGGKVFERQTQFARIISGLPTLRCVISIQQLPDSPPVPGASVTNWDTVLAEYKGATPSFTPLPSDHPTYILYSSGTTGKPKCIVHGAAGLLVNHAKELMLHGDLQPGDRLLYFTTCGWMMWNWQASALLTGATLVTVDGSPGYPDLKSLWNTVESERVTHFGTSARFLAECRKAGIQPFTEFSLPQLRTVFSTGSPLLPEDFDWFYHDGAAQRILLGSIAGGTDICGCFVGSVPILPLRRGEIQCRLLGVDAVAFGDDGRTITSGRGELVCRQPLPSMPVKFWDDPDGKRYHSSYFDTFPGVWAHGDFIEFTTHGGAIIYGRSDATLNPGGVRIGTAEIYRQVETESRIKDSLVIGRQIDGDVEIVLLVVLADHHQLDDNLLQQLRQRIRINASPRHVPRHIVAVQDIPYTRSGKKVEIMISRMINGHPYSGNLDALANPESLESIRKDLIAGNLLDSTTD